MTFLQRTVARALICTGTAITEAAEGNIREALGYSKASAWYAAQAGYTRLLVAVRRVPIEWLEMIDAGWRRDPHDVLGILWRMYHAAEARGCEGELMRFQVRDLLLRHREGCLARPEERRFASPWDEAEQRKREEAAETERLAERFRERIGVRLQIPAKALVAQLDAEWLDEVEACSRLAGEP